jgi:hypothetical protein
MVVILALLTDVVGCEYPWFLSTIILAESFPVETSFHISFSELLGSSKVYFLALLPDPLSVRRLYCSSCNKVI